MAAILAYDIGFIVISWDFNRILLFLTNWTLVLTLLCLALSLFLHSSDKGWLNAMAVHHSVFEIASILNVVTVVVYWTLCHSETMKSE